ncbi:cyclopropane-fatty-acyl-phospholipid synthase family protein [Dyadobacter sp. Leaf189]|uniref:SAM-dependent methyltransferase n=1 Tax=Dyadobacter sp. Leaf189 TaxID=1736295 RepID=UPI0006F921B1|nr:class I SAM-dependent methyltransferase [Dyadobacter sp. Leaf189]KQS24760.1 methyltransferase type 12 [Dyadobacter sp. Leaf189]
MAWYHSYFKGLPQIAWKLYQDEEYTDFEVDFLADVLEIKEGNKVLDILSGYGRHAIPLTETGCSVTCVDISAEYCEELTKVTRKKKLPIEVICKDVLEYQPEQNVFDAVYCLGNSLSFFPRADMLRFFGKIAAALKPGGHVALHTENLAESILPNFQVRNWMPVGDDIFYLAENEYRAEEGCIEAQQTFISGSEKVTHTVFQYIYTLAEITAMLQSVGLKTVGTFGNLEADPFTLGDEQLYLVAVKN